MSALARCALCPRASAADTASSSSPPPRRDYAALFERGRSGGVPPLFLAPMEGLGDRRLRRALAFSTGGFDEACREFTRVPGVLSQGARPEKLLRGIALTGYDADELTDWTKFAWNEWDQDALGTPPPTSRAPNLLAAQLMGSNEELLERCARFLANEGGAPRVDLNCGCPANVVTGKGAGSSLLRDPRDVESCAAAVARGVAGTGCAVTVKLRSGFDDRGLLRDNLLAAQEGGAEFITLHPRTRAQILGPGGLGRHRVRRRFTPHSRRRKRGRDERVTGGEDGTGDWVRRGDDRAGRGAGSTRISKVRRGAFFRLVPYGQFDV